MRPSRRSALPARPARADRPRRRPAARALEQLLDDLADVAGEEGRVRDPLSSAFSSAQATDSSETSIPQTVSASRRARADRADPAVEIPDGLAAGQPAASRASAYSRSAIAVFVWRNAFGRTGSGAAELLLDPLLAPEQPRRAGSSPRPGCRSPPIGSSAPPGSGGGRRRGSRSRTLARCGHELDESLARSCVPVERRGGGGSRFRRLRVRLEPLLARPVAYGLPDPVATSSVSQSAECRVPRPTARAGGSRAPALGSLR
jgi:hypothetical protein